MVTPAAERMVRVRSRLTVSAEVLAAAVVSALTTVAMNWSLVIRLNRIPGTGVDPLIELWSLAWSAHGLSPATPGGVFDANAFYPAQNTLAFTDSLLGFGPLAWPFGPQRAMLAFSLIFLLGSALSSFGGYLLARQLGANWAGAAVAGAAFGYPVWRLGQIGHLHVISTGPFVLALALLARGHGLRWRPVSAARRPGARPLWVLLGWLMACWQVTIGFAQGLPFAYLLGLIGLVTVFVVPIRAWRAGRPATITWPLVLSDTAGIVAFAAAGVYMAVPYLRVQQANGNAVKAARGLDQVVQYSPSWLGLITPPKAPGTWTWLTGGGVGGAATNEARVLPGAILLVLALAGMIFSVWRVRWRVVLVLLTAGSAVLMVGTHLTIAGHSPFVVLRGNFPGWASDRTPGRLIAFTVLALALLAAGFVSAVTERLPARIPRVRPVVALGAVLLPLLVLAEGWGPLPTTAGVPVPRAMRAAHGPMIVLPTLWYYDSQVMAWTIGIGFPELGNGASGITPKSVKVMRAQMFHFPDARAVAYMRATGIRSVVFVKKDLGSDQYADAGRIPDPKLGLIRTDYGDSILFTLPTK